MIERVVQSRAGERLLHDEKTIDMVKAALLVRTLGGASGCRRLAERAEVSKIE